MYRKRLAVLSNLIVPGAGLIVLRREWLGFTLAVLFGIVAQIVILGLWIVPHDIPRWVWLAAVMVTIGVWLFAQWRLLIRVRDENSPDFVQELEELRSLAEVALQKEDFDEARRVLLVALKINDEDLAVQVLWARLMGLTEQGKPARVAWKRVKYLDRDDIYASEVAKELG